MPPIIQAHALTKRFPLERGWRDIFSSRLGPPAVDGVTLSIEAGELFGLVGPNGAGKTTLIKLLATLILPTSGEAWINGFDLSRELEIKRSIGLVTSDERSFYWRLSGRQNLEFFAALHGFSRPAARERAAEMLALVGLEAQADKSFRHYSTGMKQKLSIARALLPRPKILFLDEPGHALDPMAARQLRDLIQNKLTREQGLTVVLTSHNLNEIQRICGRVAIMGKGRIRACGTLPELQAEINLQERYQLLVRGWSPQPDFQAAIPVQISPLAEERLSIHCGPPAPLDAVNDLVDTIRGAGGEIERLQPEKPALETIFTQISTDERFAVQPRELAPPPPPPPVSRRHFSALHAVAAFLRRDWQAESSYKLAFALQFVNIFFTVGVFYFVAQLVEAGANPYLEPYGGDYFSFALIGIAFSAYFGVGMTSFASSLRTAQTTGTLEAMLVTPTRLSTIILSSAQWSYLFITLRVLIYLLVGVLLLGVSLGDANYLAALVILVPTVISFGSLGIIAAAFIMVFKRGNPIAWLLSALANLLGGTYYPIAVLPIWLQKLSALIPVTYALRAMRLALLQGAGFDQLWGDILALCLFCVILLPLSLITFTYAVRRARVNGSLAHY